MIFRWEFADRDGQAEVTWGMRGRMPFFLRFMTGMTVSMIEKDFALGLAMLRGTLEDPQAERPEIRFLGEMDTASRSAPTVPFSGSKDAMVEAMEQGFPRLMAQIRDQGKAPAGPWDSGLQPAGRSQRSAISSRRSTRSSRSPNRSRRMDWSARKTCRLATSLSRRPSRVFVSRTSSRI